MSLGPDARRGGERLVAGAGAEIQHARARTQRGEVEHAFGRRRERRVAGGARPLPRLDRVSRAPRTEGLFVSGLLHVVLVG